MEKQAIMLKQEIVAAFMECEDGGDYLESGIKKFERKLDEILTAHEGETFKYQEDINHDTKTIFVPPDRYFDLRGETDKQIAKRMIEEFEKEVISEEYTFNPYQLALLDWIKRWLEKQGEQ